MALCLICIKFACALLSPPAKTGEKGISTVYEARYASKFLTLI
jgi:hypothetical protein